MLKILSKFRFCNKSLDSISEDVARNEKWPIVDLFDMQKKIRLLKQKRDQNDNIQANLQQLLGKNYQKYSQAILQFNHESHVDGETFEQRALSPYHEQYKMQDRLVPDQNHLRRIRELESPPKDYNVNKHTLLEDDDSYPVKNLQEVYKPREFCANLSENQLILFNIPLDVVEQDVQVWIEQKVQQQVEVEIGTCNLNLNAYAIITFKSPNVGDFKDQLENQRFNDCLLDVRCKKDSDNEKAINRTLVILNLNRSWDYQNVMHKVGEYGRVVNSVLPTSITNPDLPFVEDLIKELQGKVTADQPVQLEILDVETGKTERSFYPSEEAFLQKYKDSKALLIQSYFNKVPEFYDFDQEQTIIDFQNALEQKEQQRLLYKLLANKVYKCLKVPDHLKDKYRQLWMPDNNNNDKMMKTLYSKTFQNQGFCICTFSSRAMAQRALYNMASETSFDLSILPLKPINLPQFYKKDDNRHTQQKKYGAGFNVDNYTMKHMLPNLKPVKAYEGMELYHFDLMFNLEQLEKIRREKAKVQDSLSAWDPQEMQDTDNYDQRRNNLRQKIYVDLNRSNDFSQMIEEQNFSKKLSSFDDKLKPILSSKPGRQFDLNVVPEQYEAQLDQIEKLGKYIPAQEQDFADKMIEKHQEFFAPGEEFKMVLKEQENKILGEDNLLLRYRKELIARNVQSETINNSLLEPVLQSYNAEVFRSMKDESREKIAKTKLKKNNEPDSTPESNFSTVVQVNPNFVKKQALLKYKNYLEDLRRLVLGQYTEQMKKILIEESADSFLDELQFNLKYTQDNLGKQYLDQATIEHIREFDMPSEIEEREFIRQQEMNRKQLMDLIPGELLVNLRKDAKKYYTYSVIASQDIGIPTETFEIGNDVDPEQMVNDLNRFVASSGEKYYHETDPRDLKQYIVKAQTQGYKYDLSVLSQGDPDEIIAQIKQYLIEDGCTEQRAMSLIKQSLETGEMPPEIENLFSKTYGEDIDMDQLDIEKLCTEMNMTKKELEVYLNANLLKDKELFEEEIGQQNFIQEMKLKYGPQGYDAFIRDRNEQAFRVKDKEGNFILPKFKKF